MVGTRPTAPPPPVRERGPDLGDGAGNDHVRLPSDTASPAVSRASSS